MVVKKRKTLFAIVILALSVLLFSCAKSGGDDSDLLGRWERSIPITYYPGGWQSGSSPESGFVVQYYEFMSQGRGVYGQTSPTPGYATYQHTFTWTRDGNTVTINGGSKATLSGSWIRIKGETYHHTSW